MTATASMSGSARTARPGRVLRPADRPAAYIHCCTYDDAAPILSIHDGTAEITITIPGRGEVTEDDVRLGRLLADAVTRYVAELEKLAAKDTATAADR